MTNQYPWWQTGIIYQIYPRSFRDSNNDGIGDLPGIIKSLDYLQWLGIDAIWISPVYPSPMTDFGYDVSNYTDVHPIFGTLVDIDALLEMAHNRDIKVILDFVPNHTSNQHPWFMESRSSRDNPKHDWYIWRDPAPDGEPPNNWLGRFDGKSGWTWEAQRGQYYFHSFLAEQPDLNWRNTELRTAMLDVMRFWFDRGVDGFRVDVSYRVMKDAQFRDNPPNPAWTPGVNPFTRLIEKYTKNTADIHQFNRWLRALADEYEDKVLIGEINLPLPELVKHYGQQDEFHLPFNFRLIYNPWTAAEVRSVVDQYESVLPPGAWPNWVLGNHDQHRFVTRFGPEQAPVALMLLLTLRGTPTIYYGDEIGMQDVDIPSHRVQDPWEKSLPGLGLGRDPERTPMQWDDSPNAGFCAPEVEPWLPIASDHQNVNVATQQTQPQSMLLLTKKLIQIRRASLALQVGCYRSFDTSTGLFIYTRIHGDERYLIALNFTHTPQTWLLPIEVGHPDRLVLSTYLDRPEIINSGKLSLCSDEGVILQF